MAQTSVVLAAAAGAKGTYNLTGETLSAEVVTSNMDNHGGTIASGNGIGHVEVLGDLQLNAARSRSIRMAPGATRSASPVPWRAAATSTWSR